MTVPVLLGQKAKLRACVAALAEVRKDSLRALSSGGGGGGNAGGGGGGCGSGEEKEDVLGKKNQEGNGDSGGGDGEGGSGGGEEDEWVASAAKGQPLLQALAEVAWDLGREDDGEKKMKEKEGTVAVLAASFSEASAWSLAHACFAASSTAWQHTTRTPSSWDSGSDAAARGESARCALEAKASLQRALEAGEVAAAQEAVCSSSVALSFAWGTTLPLHAVAELLCLRAQAKLACAEAQDNAAQAQREASAGWFGGSRAAVTAEQHALASQASRQSAQVDVKRAKQLSPQCLGVLRWEAELELRACVQGMEELSEELSAVSSAEMSASSSTSSSSSASMAGGGGGGGVGACGDGAAGDKEDGVDALLLAELAARASEAVLRLAKAFVLDGSRDTALAQALEEGAKAATKMQAGVAFKAQMRTLNGDFGTESSSSSRSSSGSGGGGSIGTTNSPPPLPPPPAWAPPPKLQPPPPPKLLPPLPAPWMVQSFFSGFVEAVPPLPPPPPPLLLLLPQKARQRFLSALPRKAAAKLVASVVLAKEGGQGSGSGSGSGGSVGGGGGSLGKDINDIDETEGGERDDGGDGSGGVNGGGDDGADDSLPILLFLNDPLQSWRQRRGRRSNEPTTTTAMATAPATTEANDEEENDDAADAECFSLEAAAAVEEAAACLPSAYSRRLHALVAGSQRAKVAGDFGRASELAGEAAKVGWARHRCHLGGSGGAAAAAQSWRKKKAEEEDKVEASTASSAASAAASAEVAAFLKELETDLEVALTCWALEQDGSFAHLRCAFEAAEESFTRALQLLKCTTPLPTSDDDEDDAEADAEHDDAADEEGDKEEEGGGEDHDEERSADVDVASAAGSGDSPPLNHPAAGGDENGSSGKACSPAAPSGEDAYAAVLGKAAKRWARSMGSGPVARWRQSALLRCQVKLACSRTDGTEAQKISADQAFQAALDTAESLGVGEPRALHRRLGQAEKQGLADSADAERFCPTSSENMGVLEEAEEKAQSVDQSLKKRQQQRGQEKAGRDRRWGVAAAGAAGVGAFLQRGQLRLMDNELDGSLEDLKKGKSLVEALLSWTAQDQRGDQQEKQEATASAAEASRQDSSGWDGLRSTLHRLEAALCGSLGVALFKVELMRNGGAVLMGGGMPYEMARVLRVTEAKHPNQGEFLLLHGDLLAQCGDFKAALAKFKKAADACTPPPPPLAVEAASAEGAAAAAAAEEVGAAAAANQTTPPPPPPSLPPPPPPPPPPPTALPLNCPLPWVNAGRCYLQMNEGQLAERHLLMGLELDPKCSSAHLDLGQLKLQGGDLEAALTHFSDARKNSRSFPELHDAMACELVARHHQTALDELNGK